MMKRVMIFMSAVVLSMCTTDTQVTLDTVEQNFKVGQIMTKSEAETIGLPVDDDYPEIEPGQIESIVVLKNSRSIPPDKFRISGGHFLVSNYWRKNSAGTWIYMGEKSGYTHEFNVPGDTHVNCYQQSIPQVHWYTGLSSGSSGTPPFSVSLSYYDYSAGCWISSGSGWWQYNYTNFTCFPAGISSSDCVTPRLYMPGC